MKRLTFLLAFWLQGGGQPVTIAIQNPSFETVSAPGETTSCGQLWWFASSWQVASGYMAFQPANPNPCGVALPPDGQLVGLAGGGSTIFQDTGVKPYDLQVVPGGFNDGLYVLTFYVANYFPKYPGYFDVRLLVGTHELCSTDGWGTQRFTQVMLVCPAPQYVIGAKWPDPASPQTGRPIQGLSSPDDHLIISFTGDVWPSMFDNVSLSFTPN